ncbi:hypothetical protein [Carnobacterium sp. TMP28]|uniref:hypothetical protein n=1 Tax=Carnobacterium sp. TMP28 TaxID=3397060 RepID=UPI0039DFE2D7
MTGAAPYLYYLKSKNIDYDIIYIDKYIENEESDAKNLYKFELKIEKDWSKQKKLIKYFSFRKFAKKKLLQNKYDLIITWGTETALLFFDILLIHFREKYIVNIRDYANLNNYFKKKLLKIVLNNSSFSTISSYGFKKFLPEFNYIRMHSVNKQIIEKAQFNKEFVDCTQPLRICFIGNVRFYENDLKLINELANDSRFIIQFFGIGSEKLEDYTIKKRIENVEFIGSFEVSRTSELLNKADIINNLYGFNNLALDTAVSIKYYYSIYLRKPLLVYKDTYMEKVSNKISFSFNADYNNLGDRLFNWYHAMNFDDFENECFKKIKQINIENRIFEEKLESLLIKKEGNYEDKV